MFAFPVIPRFFVSKCAGIFALVLGIVVIVGWHCQLPQLIQILPQFVPMQYNTALGFFVVGLGFFAQFKQKRAVLCIFSILLTLLGVLTLLEYLLELDFGIDQAFMQHYITTETSHPGRMAPNTALCFSLVGLALLADFSRYRHILHKALGLLVFSLGMVAFTGYFMHLELAYAWADWTHMALHTSIGFIVIGLGLLDIDSRKSVPSASLKIDYWKPMTVVFIFMLLSLALSDKIHKQEVHLIQMSTKKQINPIQAEIRESINSSFLALQRMAERGQSRQADISCEEWQNDAYHYVKDLPGLVVVQWVDSEHRVRWIEPLKSNEHLHKLDLRTIPKASHMIEKALVHRSSQFSEFLELERGGLGFFVYFPMFHQDQFLGGILGVYNVRDFVAKTVPQSYFDDYALSLSLADQHVLYASHPLVDDTFRAQWSHSQVIEFAGSQVTLSLWPTPRLLALSQFRLPVIVFSIGLIVAMMVAVAMIYSQKNKIYSRRLQEQEQRLRAIINNTIDGIITIDRNGTIESFNLSCERIFGYQEAEVLGKNIKMLMPEPVRSEHDQYLHNYHKTGKKSVIGVGREVQGLRKDGSLLSLDLSVSEIKVDDQMIYTGILRDITEKQNTLRALEESKSFLSLMMDHNPNIVFVKNPKFEIVQANQAFLNVYPEEMRDSVIGSTTLESYDPQEAEEFLKMDRKAFEQGYSSTTETIDFPDGVCRTFFTQKIRFENSQGEAFILCLAQDVTEREQLIAKLFESNDELEHFAYIASHDLQEPLRMVVSFSEILKNELHDQLSEEHQRYLQISYDSAARMQVLVSDLLEYSRIHHNAEHWLLTDMAEIIDEVQSNLSESIKQSQAQIHCDSLPVINIIPTRMVRLLQNLVSNAIKYVPATCVPLIHIGAKEEQEQWVFSVQDNGIGIRSEYHEKIFSPFKRLHSYSEYQGTGLGLAMCKKIVESFGGTIWLESEEGKGSTFHFSVLKEFKKGDASYASIGS